MELASAGRLTVRLVIAGSRHLTPNVDDIDRALAVARIAWLRDDNVAAVISGCAPGVDTAGEEWARARGVAVLPYPAEWSRFGNAAGMKRNARMADAGDALLAFWNGHSPGTRDMIRQMERRGKPLYVVRVTG